MGILLRMRLGHRRREKNFNNIFSFLFSDVLFSLIFQVSPLFSDISSHFKKKLEKTLPLFFSLISSFFSQTEKTLFFGRQENDGKLFSPSSFPLCYQNIFFGPHILGTQSRQHKGYTESFVSFPKAQKHHFFHSLEDSANFSETISLKQGALLLQDCHQQTNK